MFAIDKKNYKASETCICSSVRIMGEKLPAKSVYQAIEECIQNIFYFGIRQSFPHVSSQKEPPEYKGAQVNFLCSLFRHPLDKQAQTCCLHPPSVSFLLALPTLHGVL